jgi:cobalt/nickel transport system permease protein
MHISEGVLSAPVLLGGAALTVAGTAIGLRQLNYERIMTTAMLTSAFFVASLIHVPIGPGNIHLVLNGLLGILLGWAAFPAIGVALLLQAVFFQYGGILVLGVNTLLMAGPAVLCGILFKTWLNNPKRRNLAGFLAGAVAILLSGILMASALALSDAGFIRVAQITLLSHIPLMVIEGIVTMFTLSFLIRVHPDILSLDKT